MTKFRKHTWRGLKNPVYLPDWLPVEIKIIPSSVAGWTSGQFVDPSNFTSTTWHDTGNDSSSAQGDYNWAANGGRRNVPGSYNGIFDGSKLILTQWFDELVGHAANHRGNVTSYAFEQVYGPGFEKSWEVGMWVHAGVLQAIGKTGTGAMYQHNYWSGKNCPAQIRKRNLWSATEKGVDERIIEIIGFITGEEIDPVPDPLPPPSLATFLFGKVGRYAFDPNGPISKFWLKNGNETGSFPRLLDVQEGKPKYFAFSDGSVIVDDGGKLSYLDKVKG